MMDHPEELLYNHRHVWVRPDKKNRHAEVGLTEDRLEVTPPIISIDTPLVDDELEIDTDCLHLHLSAGIQSVRAPLTGRVLEVNKEVLDYPEILHVDGYKNWLFRMEYDEETEMELMMTAKQYSQYLDHMDGH